MAVPIVSIITPCYNSENYIAETINSVISQTYIFWEMIIVDDGSSDNSFSIIMKYVDMDDRIRCIRLPYPSGSPTKPRNIAIENARGRYIAFLDSDDLWLPDKLSEQIRLLESNSDALMAFSYYEKIGEDGIRKGRIIKSPNNVRYKDLLLGNVIGCLTGIYDTNKTGKVFFNNIGHEDYLMWLSILKQGGIAINTNKVHALYRLRVGSVSANKFKTLKWQWHIYTQKEKLNIFLAIYYFVCYSFKALYKTIK